MSVLTSKAITNLIAQNPALTVSKIRIDKKTQKASVYDVIRLVTGFSSKDSANYFNRLVDKLSTNCRQLRINGKGRLTPVADAPTLVQFIWEMPGKAAKAFRRQSAHYICRLLGGDLTLVAEIERRYKNSTPEQKEFLLTNTDLGGQLTMEERLRLKKRKLELDREVVELDERRQKLMINTIEMYRTLGMNERDSLWLKGAIRRTFDVTATPTREI